MCVCVCVSFDATWESPKTVCPRAACTGRAVLHARALEAASGLQQDQLRRDTAMITLAAKQNVEYAKVAADTKIKERDLAIKEFTAGAKLELDANKQALTAQELELARTTGDGI